MSGSSTHHTLPSTVSVPFFLISAPDEVADEAAARHDLARGRRQELEGSGPVRAAAEGRGRV